MRLLLRPYAATLVFLLGFTLRVAGEEPAPGIPPGRPSPPPPANVTPAAAEPNPAKPAPTTPVTDALTAPPEKAPSGSAAAGQAVPIPVLTIDQENTVALALFRQLSGKATAAKLENAMLCPGGVTRLLRCLHTGAMGRSAAEIAKALGLDVKPSSTGAKPAALPASPPEGASVLKVASALWSDPSVPFLPAYQQTVQAALTARVASVPLVKEPEAARQTINAWAAQETGGNIPELLKKGDLRGSRLVLTDAAWFKDSWKRAFKPEATVEAEFTLPDGGKRRVAFVADLRSARVGATPEAQVLALPFTTPRYECLCVLPTVKPKETAGAALLRFERGLKPETLTALYAALAEEQRADIQLPKLDLKGLSANLVPPLQALGIKTVFTDDADFSGMSEKGAKLKVGVFKQETAFRLDESGAEASAATAAVMVTKSAIAAVKPIVFHADRPCLFLIRDTESGAIVFLIRCAAPPEAPKPAAASAAPPETSTPATNPSPAPAPGDVPPPPKPREN